MGKIKRPFRLMVRVTERTIDRHGQYLLRPAIEREGGWTRLADAATTVIELYQHHGLHEPYHAEFKTALDLERLPPPGNLIATMPLCSWRPLPTTACAAWARWG